MTTLTQTALPEILNVGCGPIRLTGSLGIDHDPQSCADVIHNLDTYPWPFPDGSFSKVICSHILEHLENPQKALREVHRISKNGALIEIVTPHYSSPDSWNDITHRYHFGYRSFRPYYNHGQPRVPFKLVRQNLGFGTGIPSWLGKFMASVFGVTFYEKYLSFIFTARNMEVILRVVKEKGP